MNLQRKYDENQNFLFELQDELADLQTQNDQLRRKAASIERELVSPEPAQAFTAMCNVNERLLCNADRKWETHSEAALSRRDWDYKICKTL